VEFSKLHAVQCVCSVCSAEMHPMSAINVIVLGTWPETAQVIAAMHEQRHLVAGSSTPIHNMSLPSITYGIVTILIVPASCL